LIFTPKKFESQIPSSFSDVYSVLKAHGLVPTLVGGVVRDYLVAGHVGDDWDMEVTHPTVAFNKDSWKEFGRDLAKLGKITFLPYEIIRIDIKNVQYEFSPPRKETFDGKSGHSNFTAEFDFKLPFNEAVKRRDFTINAMGIKFNSAKETELFDPLGGLVHLRDKKLHPAGNDFAKDPVRFLRSLRFALKLGFTPTDELHEILKTMSITGLSSSYLWGEMQKSGSPLMFLKSLLEWSQIRSDIKLPLTNNDLNYKWEELGRVLQDPTRHEAWVIALEWVGVSGESWQKYFNISSETCTRLGRWAVNTKKFLQIRPEIFHGEFDEVREKEEFNLLFDWYFTTKQLLQKNPDLPLLKMIEEYLPDWIHLYRFEVVKDVKHIDPPLRAKYQVWNICQRL
jgi:hypothetical protein